MLRITEDRYDGITVDKNTLPKDKNRFKKEIIYLLNTLGGKKLLWVKIPIEKSEFIPVLTSLGFEFHHCDEKNLMLVKKIEEDSYVPNSMNFIAGIGAVVRDDEKLLVIKDRFYPGYKLPGGHIDKGEFIKDAIKREVFEETGIDIEFESIMNIGHFNPGQFGESNIYFVCTAKPLTKEITINDSSEIIEARWIDIDEFLNSEDVNNYNKSVVEAAINNKSLKLTEKQIKMRVNGEVFL